MPTLQHKQACLICCIMLLAGAVPAAAVCGRVSGVFCNGGTCAAGTCQCPIDLVGPNCEYKCPGPSSAPCNMNGMCTYDAKAPPQETELPAKCSCSQAFRVRRTSNTLKHELTKIHTGRGLQHCVPNFIWSSLQRQGPVRQQRHLHMQFRIQRASLPVGVYGRCVEPMFGSWHLSGRCFLQMQPGILRRNVRCDVRCGPGGAAVFWEGTMRRQWGLCM